MTERIGVDDVRPLIFQEARRGGFAGRDTAGEADHFGNGYRFLVMRDQ
jgi:hypothetical protein